MREVGVYEAKTHLSQLIEDVEKGETITISRHGKPVARLVPVETGKLSRKEAVERLLAFREKHTLGGITIRELIDEGRRL
jgi:prevent-host-death family protein